MLSHTDPPLVRRLVDRLVTGDPTCAVVVDHDPAGPGLGELGPAGRVHVRGTPRAGGWGGFGLVDGTLRSLDWIRRELAPAWVVLLSGQHYPTQPPARVRDQLLATDADALMDAWRVVDAVPASEADRWWTARYFDAWWSLPRAPIGLPAAGTRIRLGLQRRLSLAQPWLFVWSLPRGQGTRVGVRRRRVPFSPEWPCRAGSQWFALSARALEGVCAFAQRRPDVVAHYRRTIIPDESFFVTVVGNDPDLRPAGPSPTYAPIDGSHAALLQLSDLDAVVASGRFFARKVESVASAALLDALDERIAGGGAPEPADSGSDPAKL